MTRRTQAQHPTTKDVTPQRARHLERNRVAANKCRLKKKQEHQQIQRRLSDETEKHDLLVAQIHGLREEMWELKNRMFQHVGCEDTHINHQLQTMTQNALLGSNSSLGRRPSSTFSVGTAWSDESPVEPPVEHDNLSIGDVAADLDASTLLTGYLDESLDDTLPDLMFDELIDPQSLQALP
ncbi:hypothetical protein NUU61_005410 [Penicillium alfredii]|uniref:BZIP domain-containing protein n=1 Tax=Penicillium alfredii TaxID=1506179 RepID=A0A9W9F9I0_9EURO|nr:uncharacterized protein NUU61_005410 [Penicillium alfredii]KAJ5096054.1 hypothetical protein NUU61_005410 [Penicillium alfredii]